MARNAELEAAILAADHDPQAYLVYADWLQSHGDPRGELVVLQHQGRDEDAQSLLDRHRAQFLGRFAEHAPETFSLGWRCGFIRSATIGWEMFSPIDDEDTCEDQLVAFLELDAARLVEELVLGPVAGEDELANGALASAIDRVRPLCLRKLYLGDTGDWDISSTSTRIPRSESIQALRELTLRGGQVYFEGEIDLPALVSFTVESGSLVAEDLRTIAAARWPALEHLEIWFGDPNYGASGGVADIAPILEARGLPKLRSLGLRNCPFADELVQALASAPVLPQLHSLDLSMGNLGDRGVAAMLSMKDRFAHLASLNLEDNALTDASWPAARALAKQVTFGNDHHPERALPRDPSERYRRFVSVGE